MRRLALLTLVLAGCSGAGVTISLQPVTLNLAVVAPTADQVVYPAQPETFTKSPLAVNVRLSGDITPSNLATSVQATFYARGTSPQNDAQCQPVVNGSYYVCPASAESANAISSTLTFSNNQATPFTFSGGGLNQGASNGTLWVGIQVQSGGGISPTFTFNPLELSLSLN
jgi:hypothetical protein